MPVAPERLAVPAACASPRNWNASTFALPRATGSPPSGALLCTAPLLLRKGATTPRQLAAATALRAACSRIIQLIIHPVSAVLRGHGTGQEGAIRPKFLVGSDSAASTIHKQLQILYDSCSTGLCWGTISSTQTTPTRECLGAPPQLSSPVITRLDEGRSVMSSGHGACVIIPREDGYIRLAPALALFQPAGPTGAGYTRSWIPAPPPNWPAQQFTFSPCSKPVIWGMF